MDLSLVFACLAAATAFLAAGMPRWPLPPSEQSPGLRAEIERRGEIPRDSQYLARAKRAALHPRFDVMAREKALYDGHAVAEELLLRIHSSDMPPTQPATIFEVWPPSVYQYW